MARTSGQSLSRIALMGAIGRDPRFLRQHGPRLSAPHSRAGQVYLPTTMYSIRTLGRNDVMAYHPRIVQVLNNLFANAVQDRRHQTDGASPRTRRPAGHLSSRATTATRPSRVLEAFAADYIVYPFSPAQLTVRAGTALRGRCAVRPRRTRHRRRTAPGDRGRTRRGAHRGEYEILRVVSAHAGREVTSASLLRQAWDNPEPIDTDRVYAFVKQTRAKLGHDAADPRYGSSTSAASATVCPSRGRSEERRALPPHGVRSWKLVTPMRFHAHGNSHARNRNAGPISPGS